MTQTTQSLHSDNVSRHDAHVADAVEHGNAGTQQWGDVSGLGVLWHPHSGFCAQRSILAISAIPRDAVDSLVRTHLEETAAASAAIVVVSAVPGPTHAVADFPFLLGGWDGDDCAYKLVAEALDLSAVDNVSIEFAESQQFQIGRDLRRSHVSIHDVAV